MKNRILCFLGSVLLILGFLYTFCIQEAVAADASATLYHQHTGSGNSGGGCYGEKKSVTRQCGSYSLSVTENPSGGYNYHCNGCGYNWTHPYNPGGFRCENQISYTYYERNCGLGEDAVAILSCQKSSGGWVKELDLIASYQVLHGSCQPTGYIWNGKEGGNTLHVTANGVYRLQLKTASTNHTSPTLSITVDHIDNQPPIISSFSANTEGYARQKEVRVEAQDNESGLAGQPYSFDSGASWTDNPVFAAGQNGSYTVWVRDMVGNQSTATVQVSGIDQTEPEVQVTTSPAMENWYDGTLTITVQASDGDSGLPEMPYSFDGGNNFGSSNTCQITSDCNLTIVVSDRAGNRRSVTISARKKVRPQASPSPNESTTGGNSNAAGSSGVSGSSDISANGGNAPSADNNKKNSDIFNENEDENTAGTENSNMESGSSDTINKAADAGESESKKSGESAEVQGIKPSGSKDVSGNTGRTQNNAAVEGTEKKGGRQEFGKTPEKGMDMVFAEADEGDKEGTASSRQHYPLVQTPTLSGILLDAEQITTEDIVEESEMFDIKTENIDDSVMVDINQGNVGKSSTYHHLQEFLLPVSICALAAGLVLLIPMLISGCGVMVYAKNADGKFRLVGITRIQNKEHKRAVHLQDRMVKRAQTNDFKLHLPTLMDAWKKEKRAGRIVVKCRSISRELPAKRIIHLRLKCE